MDCNLIKDDSQPVSFGRRSFEKKSASSFYSFNISNDSNNITEAKKNCVHKQNDSNNNIVLDGNKSSFPKKNYSDSRDDLKKNLSPNHKQNDSVLDEQKKKRKK